MPNKCTKCGKLHDDDADYLLTTGCDSCGGRFFFFVREEIVPEIEREVSRISRKEMEEIEHDIREMIPAKERPGRVRDRTHHPVMPAHGKKNETVILDIEAIKVIKPGKYRINVDTLFSQRPIIVRVGTGKYEIDLSVLPSKAGKGKP